MNNKFEDWMNNQFAPWALTVVLGTNFCVFMLILGQLAFGKWVMKNFEREVDKLACDSILNDIPKNSKGGYNNQPVGVDLDQIDILRGLSIIRSNDTGYKVSITALVREAIRDLFIKYNIN